MKIIEVISDDALYIPKDVNVVLLCTREEAQVIAEALKMTTQRGVQVQAREMSEAIEKVLK